MVNIYERYVIVDGSDKRFGAESIAKSWRNRGFMSRVEKNNMNYQPNTKYIVLAGASPLETAKRKILDKYI